MPSDAKLRTIRASGGRLFCLYAGGPVLLLLLPMLLQEAASNPSRRLVDYGMLVLLLVLIPSTIRMAIARRLEADDEGVKAYDAGNRLKFGARYEDMTAYIAGKGVQAGEAVANLAVFDEDQISALIAERAPQALRAKRWKCGLTPPIEDFHGLGIFDLQLWGGSFLVVALTLGLLEALFHHFPWGGLIYFTLSWPPLCYDLREVLATLSITSEGITERWPTRSRTIKWEEVTAVFRDKNMGRDTVLVTGPDTAIRVPPHLILENEPMRKLFFNLPDGTRMVNFDKTFRIGKRKRKRTKAIRKEPLALDLDPAF